MTLVWIVFAIYYFLLLAWLAGWSKSMKRASPKARPPQDLRISVVVPFRDEEKNILNIIHDLTRQDYLPGFFEVIFSNDHSSDASVSMVRDAISDLPHFRLVHSTLTGKKQALTAAIENASGVIIVTTDADCRVQPEWLTAINNSFWDNSVKMVFGAVRIKPGQSFFSRLQAIELSSLIGTAAASKGLGFPTLCNGANLSFLKSAFTDVNGYEGNLAIPSGDDEFLMRKINDRFPRSINFMNNPASIVSTSPQSSLREFVHQRLRWAGKWKYNSSFTTILLAVFILSFQLAFLTLLMQLVINPQQWPIPVALLGLKIILEYVFLFQVGTFLQLRWRVGDFLVLQLLYPLYVIFIGLVANFTGYRWKGRKLKNG